ncbi:EamA-like transporter family protein [Azospirillum brasilense]|nr:EamA-like transporter family protein [Azospirillum brasilense]
MRAWSLGAGRAFAFGLVATPVFGVVFFSACGSVSVSFVLACWLCRALEPLAPAPRLAEAVGGAGSWVTWTGGLFGALFIGTAILMVPRLGAATVLALIVVGQMLGSLVFDHVGLLGLPQQPISPTRLAGAASLILGVVLIRL